MRKGTYIFLLLFLLITLLLLCALYGCFRKKEELNDEYVLALNKAYDNRVHLMITQEDQDLFKQLWHEHVDLTRQVIVATFKRDPNLSAMEAQLLANQENIGSLIDKYYPGSKEVIVSLLKEHILQAKDILIDLKNFKILKLVKDINKWYNNADKVADALLILNPSWKLKSHMAEHLRFTELEAIYEWLGLRDFSKNIYETKIEPQAQEIANHLINGLV